MLPRDINTPLWQLTIGEFLEVVQHAKMLQIQESDFTNEERYVFGLDGLAKIFGCSKRAASTLKASGKIDKAITQSGRKIVVDVKMALELAGR